MEFSPAADSMRGSTFGAGKSLLREQIASNRVDRMRRQCLKSKAHLSSVFHGNDYMTTAHMNGAIENSGLEASEEMARYGIKRVSIEYFYFGEYGYVDLKDAIAQAKREARRVRSIEPLANGLNASARKTTR